MLRVWLLQRDCLSATYTNHYSQITVLIHLISLKWHKGSDGTQSALLFSSDAHGSNSISGCSDTDGENVLILDDEAVWYADFNKQTGVNALPAFADPISFPGFYEEAVADQQICRQNLMVIRKAMKDFPKELGKHKSLTTQSVCKGQKNIQRAEVNKTCCCVKEGFSEADRLDHWRSFQLCTFNIHWFLWIFR